MIEIIPSILTSSLLEAKEKIEKLEGLVQRVQIDVVDGFFANNKTFDPSLIGSIDTTLVLDFHLMTDKPINWIEKCATAGADRIIGQIEKMESQVEFVGKVQEVGCSVGLAIDLETSVDSLDPVILTNLDVVLVMSVPAGFGGQKFDSRVLAKVDKLDKIRQNDKTPFRICVDGGESASTIRETHFKGADEVVIGRGLFEGNIEDNLKRLQEAAHGLRNG